MKPADVGTYILPNEVNASNINCLSITSFFKIWKKNHSMSKFDQM